ncbi:MAG TPA: glycosyltransferase family 4 protein [Thermoanaerobaculia bacterium]|nr:glycosyltransferase family 4 protein [Thermoanaerobaculia bacterium]
MRIAYLVAEAGVSGGVRITLAQADALVSRGHEVVLVTEAGPVEWRPTDGAWLEVGAFEEIAEQPFDFVVGTFWSTVRRAWAIAGERTVHLCQGYEGAFAAYQDIRNEIDDTYRLPIPKITVSRHLVPICRTFHDDVTYVGQIVDDEFYRSASTGVHTPPRVILCGQAQGDMKGIEDGYAAVRHARQAGQELELVRVSPWSPADGEPVDDAGEFHVTLPVAEMTKVMHGCDVLIAPNRREEGFGLPAAEAMASRIPTVLTEIPSYLSLGEVRDYALFAPERDPVALGHRLIELLADSSLRERIAVRGAEVAEQFRAEHVAVRLEKFFSDSMRKRRSGR